MLISRDGQSPRIDPAAKVAATAQVVGNVSIGAGCYIDHNVVVASAGPPIEIGTETIVFAGSVIRSVGGPARPAFPMYIGGRTMVAPLCALTGCRIGAGCYLATGVIVLQGAVIGDHSRVGVGAMVHAATRLPARARVGLRHIAAPTDDGYISTADIQTARAAVGAADFFDTAFGTTQVDQARLHDEIMTRLLEEVHGWHDQPPEAITT